MPSFIPATGITLHLEGECVNRIGVLCRTWSAKQKPDENAATTGAPVPPGTVALQPLASASGSVRFLAQYLSQHSSWKT